MLIHGGDLSQAIQRYGRPLARWIDLSTGINPHGWPVPDIPAALWHHLPPADDLADTARRMLGFPHVLPVAGTQTAIQALPLLRPPCRVAIPALTYAEHEACWRRHGHTLIPWTPATPLHDIDVLILVHPNNPTGQTFASNQLWLWQAELAQHGGWLIIDESFMDPTPEHSLLNQLPLFAHEALPDGLIILRGLGKFFGLAGARVGLVGAAPELLEPLAEILGPWPISAPSRWIAQQALSDKPWQDAMRNKLKRESERLHSLLHQRGFSPKGGTALFQWVITGQSRRLHDHLAQHGLWTRHFEHANGIRIGIPSDETAWQRLADGLSSYRR